MALLPARLTVPKYTLHTSRVYRDRSSCKRTLGAGSTYTRAALPLVPPTSIATPATPSGTARA